MNPPSAHARAERLSETLSARVDTGLAHSRRAFGEIWALLQVLLFVVYLVLAAVSFWLAALSLLLVVPRLIAHVGMVPVLWLAGGLRGRGEAGGLRDEARHWWRTSGRYQWLVAPDGGPLESLRRGGRRFRQFSMARKLLAVLVTFYLVVLPALFLVPRPRDVRVVDNNMLVVNGTTVRHLVHAQPLGGAGLNDLFRTDGAWWFGHPQPENLRARLRPGRTVRIWIIGVRWWLPTLFPTIIAVSDPDERGDGQ